MGEEGVSGREAEQAQEPPDLEQLEAPAPAGLRVQEPPDLEQLEATAAAEQRVQEPPDLDEIEAAGRGQDSPPKY